MGELNFGLDDIVTDALDEEREAYGDDERAIAILCQCTALYRKKLRSAMEGIAVEALKEISELYRVPAALIYHASEKGCKNAHCAFSPCPPGSGEECRESESLRSTPAATRRAN